MKRKNWPRAVKKTSIRVYKDGLPVDVPFFSAVQYFGVKDETILAVCPNRSEAQDKARALAENLMLEAAA